MVWYYYYCSCILLKFYIKPQLVLWYGIIVSSCILLKFYIKPQLRMVQGIRMTVVSY